MRQSVASPGARNGRRLRGLARVHTGEEAAELLRLAMASGGTHVPDLLAHLPARAMGDTLARAVLDMAVPRPPAHGAWWPEPEPGIVLSYLRRTRVLAGDARAVELGPLAASFADADWSSGRMEDTPSRERGGEMARALILRLGVARGADELHMLGRMLAYLSQVLGGLEAKDLTAVHLRLRRIDRRARVRDWVGRVVPYPLRNAFTVLARAMLLARDLEPGRVAHIARAALRWGYPQEDEMFALLLEQQVLPETLAPAVFRALVRAAPERAARRIESGAVPGLGMEDVSGLLAHESREVRRAAVIALGRAGRSPGRAERCGAGPAA